MAKKKLVFISNIAAPYQVKFCYSLQKYFDVQFWFYKRVEKHRPDWWKIPLGGKCKVMKLSGKIPKIGYFSFGLFTELIRFRPDIIMLGGFMKWHWLALSLVKLFNKKSKVLILSEPLRLVNNKSDSSSTLWTKNKQKTKVRLLKKMFKNADLYCGMGKAAAKQFTEEFGFPENKVATLYYPQDIDAYFSHPLREKKKGDLFTILFASRLIKRYQPLFVLKVFEKIKERYSNVRLLMNNHGPLKEECIDYIKEHNLKEVKFLDNIDSWNNMHLIYKNSDIIILPATYSNGSGAVIEARASGMGVVISNKINNIEKHSINGKNCFICDLNINEFVEAIMKYIENPDILKSHGKLSRKLVEYRRNDSTAKLYYEVFEKYGILNSG